VIDAVNGDAIGVRDSADLAFYNLTVLWRRGVLPMTSGAIWSRRRALLGNRREGRNRLVKLLPKPHPPATNCRARVAAACSAP